MKKNRIQIWWKDQSTTVKAAFVTGFFALGVAMLGFTGTILVPMINYYISQVTTKDNNSINYPLHTNPLFAEPSILYIRMYDESYSGAIPTRCVQAIYGEDHIEQFDEKKLLGAAQRQSYAFDIVTEQPLVITNALVILDGFLSPPSEEEISEIKFYDPPGMGSVPIVYFPETHINSSTEETIITLEDGSLKLDPGDAVTLVIPIIFSDPGLYHLHFVIEGQRNLGSKVNLISDEFSYGWMYIDEITNIPIKTLSGTKINWLGECP